MLARKLCNKWNQRNVIVRNRCAGIAITKLTKEAIFYAENYRTFTPGNAFPIIYFKNCLILLYDRITKLQLSICKSLIVIPFSSV